MPLRKGRFLNMAREDHPIIEGLPKGKDKQQRVIEHLEAIEAGSAIPYFRDSDGRLKYLDRKGVDKITGEVKYGLNDLTKKLEREARYAAKQLALTPQLQLFEEVWGKEVGKQVFLEELSKLNAKFDSADPSLYDIDHMGSKKFLYPHMARNLNPQLSVYNRSEGARELTSEQEAAFRIAKNDLKTTIQLQGPEMTQEQADQVMGRVAGGPTGELFLQSKRNGGVGLSLRPPTPLAVAQDIAETTVTSMAELQEKGINPLQATTQALMGKQYEEETEIKVPAPADSTAVIPTVKRRLEAGEKARERGGKFTTNVGGVNLTFPEFGLSEILGIN